MGANVLWTWTLTRGRSRCDAAPRDSARRPVAHLRLTYMLFPAALEPKGGRERAAQALHIRPGSLCLRQPSRRFFAVCHCEGDAESSVE
jgi:hypothetical protein